jgi:hypothetical protein
VMVKGGQGARVGRMGFLYISIPRIRSYAR